MTIQESIEKCLRYVESTRADNTAKAYRNGLRQFAIYLGENEIKPTAPMSELTAAHFILFPSWIAGRYAKKTAGLYATSAKKFLTWLVLNGDFELTYSETMRLDMAAKDISRKRESLFPRFPAEGDVSKMLESVRVVNWGHDLISLRNIALLECMACTGCRVSELCNLSRKDFVDSLASAVVMGKGKKQRTVYFSSMAKSALKTYWQACHFSSQEHPAFCRHDKGVGGSERSWKILGISERTAENIVENVRKVAGIEKFTPHYFRHAFAIKVLEQTSNLALVQDYLGHVSPASTRVYAKIRPQKMLDAHKDIFD